MVEHIEIKKLADQDLDKMRQLLLVFEDVFEQQNFRMSTESHLNKVLAKPEHLVFVALLDNIVIGGLTAYILQVYEEETSIVYINDLAILAKYQRKGIGQQLIKSINAYCKTINISEVFIQADADEYAVNFYRKTGGKEMKVAQFTYELNNRSE